MAAFRCPNCGADMRYDPELKLMSCDYCGSKLSLPEYNKYLSDNKTDSYMAQALNCTQCGAELIATDVTAQTFCSYCGSPTLIPGRLVEQKRPAKIVPFGFKAESAKQIYKHTVNNSFFAPDWIKSEEGVARVRGIYMPFYSYDLKFVGDYEGEAVHSYTSGGYDHRDTYDIATTITGDMDDIVVDGARSFPDNLSRGLYPYDIDKSGKAFDASYMSGYYADMSDVDPNIYGYLFRTYGRLYMHNNKRYLRTPEGYTLNSADVSKTEMNLEEKLSTVFLPVYFLHFRNKDKISYAAINGTSRKIAMDMPIDFRKYLGVVFIVAAVICTLLNSVITLTPASMLKLTIPMLILSLFAANKKLNELYRSKHRLNDRGYGATEPEKHFRKVKYRPVLKKIYLWTSWFIFMFIFVAIGMALDVEFPTTALIGSILLDVWTAGLLFGKPDSKPLETKKAPWTFKAYTMGKIIAGLAAAVYVIAENSIEDMRFYVASIFAMGMVVWAFFDIVTDHNKIAMRDIPIFTEKRAGDEFDS